MALQNNISPVTTTSAISGSIFSHYITVPSNSYTTFPSGNAYVSFPGTSYAIVNKQPAQDDIGKFIETLRSAGVTVLYFNMDSDNLENFNLCLKLAIKQSIVSEMNKNALKTGTLKDISIIILRGGYDEETLEVTMNFAIGKMPRLFDGDSLMKFIFEVFPKISEELIINKIEDI